MCNKICGHMKFGGGLEDNKDILGIRVASIDVHSQNHMRSHLENDCDDYIYKLYDHSIH